jgi:hypothetical protein
MNSLPYSAFLVHYEDVPDVNRSYILEHYLLLAHFSDVSNAQ